MALCGGPAVPGAPLGVAAPAAAPRRRVVVQKFGGTSLGSADRLLRVAQIVQQALADGDEVHVVLSAISPTSKSAGTTTRLLQAAELAVNPQGDPKGYEAIVSELRELHLRLAQEALADHPALFAEAAAGLQHECEQLRLFLGAAQVLGELSTKSHDAVIGVGEKLACHLLVHVLRSIGVEAAMVNLCRVIEEQFDESHLDQQFYAYLRDVIVKRTRQTCAAVGPAAVPVVTGYFGFVPGGIVRSIGRGYTDFTASLLAAGAGAAELQIWKQVDGVFSADPTRVPTARLLPSITPAEAAELTYYGAEVIHPFTMEQAVQASVAIRIKNSLKPDQAGTLILPEPLSGMQSPEPYTNGLPESRKRGVDDAGLRGASPALEPVGVESNGHVKRPRLGSGADRTPTAVTVKAPMVVVNVRSNRKSLAHGFMESMFAILNRHAVVVDLISTSEVVVSMAIHPVDDRRLEQAIRDLSSLGIVTVHRDLAIISLVGKHMKHNVGMAARMFTALADEGVNIEMISQGASEINISCVIANAHAARALAAVHDRLILGRPPPREPSDDPSTAA